MEAVLALLVLVPLVLFFLLTLAVTVHFFWLARQGRWPPDLPPPRQSASAAPDRPLSRRHRQGAR